MTSDKDGRLKDPGNQAIRFLAALLLIGTLALAAGAAVHPHLHPPAESALHLIASTHAWRTIHLTMLVGTGLIMVGIWCRVLQAEGGPAASLAWIAVTMVVVGHAVNAQNTLFMTGAGTRMAALHAQGAPGMVMLFEATHPFGLIAARLGNFIVALGALVLGLASGRDGEPRWVGMLAWVAGLGGLGAVLLSPESSLLILAPIGLLCFWQAAVAVRILRG